MCRPTLISKRGQAISKPTVARSTAIMSLSTMLSRVTGFVRTWAIAYALGVSTIAASYSVANNIPNMIYELVAGGILSTLFIPVFLERMEAHGKDDAWRFASYLLNLTIAALTVVAVLGTIFAEAFVRTQTFRVTAEDAALATYFFRFFAVQVVFYGAGAIISGLLNSQRKFLWPALGPVFNNVVVIVTLLGFYVPFRESNPRLAMAGLAVGTSLGVVVMFAVQIPSLMRIGWRYVPRIDFKHPGVRRIGRMAVHSIIYVATNVVAISFRNAYAFDLSPNGPATLLYAWMFYQLPYGVLGVALATAVFTELSNEAGRKDWAAFKNTFASGFRTTAVLIVPMAAMLIVCAEPLITLYRAGRFTAGDVPVVAEVLTWWAVALPFYATTLYVLRTFYSLQDTRTPAMVNAVLTIMQVGLYATLTVGIGAWSGLGLKGIPISDAVFYALSVIVYAEVLRRRVGGYAARSVVATVVKMVVSSGVGAAAAWWLLLLTDGLSDIPAGFVLQLLVAGLTGLAVTYALAAVLGVSEVGRGAAMARRVLARRLGRAEGRKL